MSFRFSARGTYHVRESESYRPVRNHVNCFECIVKFLDDTDERFFVDRKAKARILYDVVFEHLELVEKDYFGLQYFEPGPSYGMNIARWLDPAKSLRKQLRYFPPHLFYFRVKFYVSDPKKLHEEYTRYHLFLQLKSDILDGKLPCPRLVAAKLAAFAVQSELGDYNHDEHTSGYLHSFRFVPKQDADFEDEVAAFHQTLGGQTPADAELNYLNESRSLDMYGVELFSAVTKDSDSACIDIGVSSTGILIFENEVRSNTFLWEHIIKLSFKRRTFFLQLHSSPSSQSNRDIPSSASSRASNGDAPKFPSSTTPSGGGSFVSVISFTLDTPESCKDLWKTCVERHTFFRLHLPPPPAADRTSAARRFIQSFGTKFNFRFDFFM